MTTKTLSDLKAGDEVFVVEQKRRHQKGEPTTYTATIDRVVRKYAYIKRTWQELAFDRRTGFSLHGKDCNARANGMGFDVYLTESDYLEREHAKAESERLASRLLTRYGLIDLDHAVVEKIHAVLDEAELP